MIVAHETVLEAKLYFAVNNATCENDGDTNITNNSWKTLMVVLTDAKN